MEEPGQGYVGTRVAGRYDVVRLLGRGGMGAVYEATHAFTGKRVALKLLDRHYAQSETAVQRFLREAQAPSNIGHPGIVEVLDAGTENGELYLVMELLDGRELGRAISEEGVTVGWLVTIARQLLDALATAHERGFVHRDIKPENVFLSADEQGEPRAKLLDFGISRQLDLGEARRLTQTGMVLGTPYYMSPEQARGDPVDGRSDLWSLGATLYHALAGRPPFEGQNYNALIAAILTERSPPLSELRPDLPSSLTEVVERSLRRDPDERWPSAGAMAAALDRCRLDGETAGRVSLASAPTLTSTGSTPVAGATPEAGSPSGAASTPGPVTRTQEGVVLPRRSRLPLALGATVVVALAAGAVWLSSSGPGAGGGDGEGPAAAGDGVPAAAGQPVVDDDGPRPPDEPPSDESPTEGVPAGKRPPDPERAAAEEATDGATKRPGGATRERRTKTAETSKTADAPTPVETRGGAPSESEGDVGTEGAGDEAGEGDSPSEGGDEGDEGDGPRIGDVYE